MVENGGGGMDAVASEVAEVQAVEMLQEVSPDALVQIDDEGTVLGGRSRCTADAPPSERCNERIGRSAWYMVAEAPVPANASLDFASAVVGAAGRWRRYELPCAVAGLRAVASVSQWWEEAATVTQVNERKAERALRGPSAVVASRRRTQKRLSIRLEKRCPEWH